MSANRSKVVIESNLKPSQFGKPASIVVDRNNKTVEVNSVTSADDDFEKVYENPLEKLKPSPPSHSSIGCAAVQAISSFRASVGAENSGNYESNIQILNFDGDVKSGDEKTDAKIGYANRGFDQDFDPYNHANADPNSKYKSNRSSAQDDSNHHLIQLENRASVDREKIIISSTIPPNSTNSAPMIEDKADISFKTIVNVIKSLDVNRYATKKTIAQGMLDIALLTANASQLKYILQIGKQHEFYTLMLSLICVSIGLQIFSGLLSLSLNLMRDCKMDDNSYARSVEWIGKARVTLSFAVFLVIQGVICVLLGSTYNINKTQDQRKANIWNNICLILMVLTVSVNAVISAFDMRSNTGFDPTVTKGSAAAITGLTSNSGVR